MNGGRQLPVREASSEWRMVSGKWQIGGLKGKLNLVNDDAA